jgi:hypothetical protein
MNEQWNDDLPNAGSAAIDLARPTPGVREIDTSRNNLALPAATKLCRTISGPQSQKEVRAGKL